METLVIIAQIVTGEPVYVVDFEGINIALPACQYEDSENCFWDSKNMGDGDGQSFYVIDGIVTYVEEY